MAKFRIEARAEWRQNKERKSDRTPIESINPGASSTDWQSEKLSSIEAWRTLFKTAGEKKQITFLLNPNYAIKVLPKGRDIDFLSVEIRPWGADKAALTPTCSDLSVIRHVAAGDKQTAVTLQLSKGSKFANID